jgi:hypothetical protein
MTPLRLPTTLRMLPLTPMRLLTLPPTPLSTRMPLLLTQTLLLPTPRISRLISELKGRTPVWSDTAHPTARHLPGGLSV